MILYVKKYDYIVSCFSESQSSSVIRESNPKN